MSKSFTVRRLVRLSWCFVLLITLAILAFGCTSQGRGPSSTKTPQEMFEILIAQPLPDNISDLQGVGDTEQGYSIFLRFQTGMPFIVSHLREGYKEVDCKEVLSHLELPKGYDRFTPSWDPGAIEPAICYRSVNSVTNSWTQQGHHYFLVDARTLTIYFHGVGE